MERKEVLVPQAELDRQKDFEAKIRAMFERREAHPTACVDTFGCQQNVADGQKLMGMLLQCGFTLTEEPKEADLVILNTCAIREHAEQRVFGNLGILTHSKKENPEQVIALCGCMAQEERVSKRIKESYRHVDLVFGPHALWRFPELLWQVYDTRKRVFAVDDEHGSIAEGIPVVREKGVKAWVSIMYGCNNFCSYCIVPYVRGRERSRDPQCVLEEVRDLVEHGYKDITLLGQNVNSYGNDLDLDYDFADLLADIDQIPGETEAEAMDTVSLVEEVGYDALFTFLYSPRPGTKAAEMPDPATKAEKQKWFDKLLEVQNAASARLHAAYVGKTERVLVDGESDDPEYPLTARTDGNRLVRLKGDPSLMGQFTDVKITGSNTWALYGEAL